VTTITDDWEVRFPHQLTEEEVKRGMFEGGYWTSATVVAHGDYCTNTFLQGLCHCDLCGKDKPNDALSLAFANRPGTTDPEDDDFGFYVLCNECDPNGDHAVVPSNDLAAQFEELLAAENKVSTGGTNTTIPSYGSNLPPAKKWVQKCPDGHFDFLNVGPNDGGLIMSSWRGKKGGMIDVEADYCMFFTSEWEEHWRAPAEVFAGSDGRTMPDLPSEPKDELPPMVSLKWWDYSAPEETVVKYAELAARLAAEGKVIQFGCIGGHGRTGTFLALILLKLGVVNDGDEAIKFVHQNYCEEAIESKSQEGAVRDYAKRLYGDAVAEDGGQG
jgi:hypothetical protein